METTIFIHGSIGLIPPYIYGLYIYGIYIYGIYGGLMKKTGESGKKRKTTGNTGDLVETWLKSVPKPAVL